MPNKKIQIECPDCSKIRILSYAMKYLLRKGGVSGRCGSCAMKYRDNNYWKGKHFSEEHKEKISQALKGIKRSEKTKKKMSKAKKGKPTGRIPKTAFKKGEYTEIMRKGSIAGARTCAEKKTTSIEKKVYRFLEKNKINFEKQKNINDKFLVDAYLSDYNIILEIDGDYWHSLERVQKKDKAENAYLKKCGYKLIRLTELEVNNNNFKNKLNKILT